LNTNTILRIRYPRIAWLVIGFNALLCLVVAVFIEWPFNLIFYVVSVIAALQAIGFALANITLAGEHLHMRHFFRTDTIDKAAINSVDSKNFRTVLVVLNNGETKQLPAFGLDSFNTAKTIRSWVGSD